MNSLETNDLFKGAYFLTRSFKLIETKYVDGHQVRFVLEGENIEAEEICYQTGHALADPRQLKDCVKLLRDLLYKTLNQHQPRKHYAENPRRNP